MMYNDALKKLRLEKGVSQQKVADYLNITKQAYSLYELGKREPDFETLLKLGEYFEVSTDYLLRGTEEIVDEELSGVDFALQSETKTLTEEQKQSVLNYVKFLKSQE
ncbi:MAG: helix-turn-helix transcriptional regulator [Oscillospiraceae bacterium]|nr:helix-turn-helix transcriptional regulator [Oscillospiraceae bacterium]MBQ8379072.1 helix-turn-helix transcriptional regulator [Oscillospiraceae bacterium]MBQ8883084.1 helix-turn-helix transcriptional regulator [Oscillospiraceae bacterium]